MSADDLIRDPATIRLSWDDDDPEVTRIATRVKGALSMGLDKAVIAVVLDETDKARAGVDELRASVTEYEGSLQAAQSRLARVRELADRFCRDWGYEDDATEAAKVCGDRIRDVLGVQA